MQIAGKQNKQAGLKNWIIRLTFVFIVSVPFMQKLELEPFHGDENLWLHSSKYFKLFFLEFNTTKTAWREYITYDQPPVGIYIMGLGLTLAGLGDSITTLENMKLWDFNRDYDWNVTHGALPPMKALYVARLTMAIFGILTCLLVYSIGKMVFGAKTGMVAALILAYNPIMLHASRKAMTDAPLIFFLTANVALIILFYRNLLTKKYKNSLLLAPLIGINIGLATGTKLNGTLAAIVFTGFCLLVIAARLVHTQILRNPLRASIARIKSDQKIKTVLASLIASGILSTSVFVGLNPNLYEQPINGSLRLFMYRMATAQFQQQHFGNGLFDPREKIEFVIKKTLLSPNDVTLANLMHIPADFLLFLFGLLMLFWDEVRTIQKNEKWSLKMIVVVWTVITFAFIIRFIPIAWERYCLPAVPCVAIILGYALSKIGNWCWPIILKLNSQGQKER